MSQLQLVGEKQEPPRPTKPRSRSRSADEGDDEEPKYMHGVDWSTLQADRSVMTNLMRRVTRYERRAGKKRPVMSTVAEDLDAAVQQGALRLYGIRIEPPHEFRTLRELKQDALAYLEEVRGKISDAAARAYRETVNEAERPGPIKAAGKQLAKMVAHAEHWE